MQHCGNKPCEAKGKFTNAKDGRHFCSLECAKGFYKGPNVRVSEIRKEPDQGEFVEVSKRHPAFSIMGAKDKEAFLSFGREDAVGLGAVRQDAHLVHKAVKAALDMIGAGEDDDKKKRKPDDEDELRKKQQTREENPVVQDRQTRTSLLQTLPSELQVVSLRYVLVQELNMRDGAIPKDQNLSPNFFKNGLFLDLLERNLSQMPYMFLIEGDNSATRSIDAFSAFTKAAQEIVLQDKGNRSEFSIKLMRLVTQGLKLLQRVHTEWGWFEPVDKKIPLLLYAKLMCDECVSYRSQSASVSILKELIEAFEKSILDGPRLVVLGKEEYIASLMYCAGWFMEDFIDAKSGDIFNPMADGYLFIEFVRQVAHGTYESAVFVEAFETFTKKLFKFEPKGRWVNVPYGYPYNPFFTDDAFFESRSPYVPLTTYAYRNRLSGNSFTLKMTNFHIKRYSPEMRLQCYHRFPITNPLTGDLIDFPPHPEWKAYLKSHLIAYIQSTDLHNFHLCASAESRLDTALWKDDFDVFQLPEVEPDESLGSDANNKAMVNMCGYRDRNGNVARFKLSTSKSLSLFARFLKDLKEKMFVVDPATTIMDQIDRWSNPATRPALVECYVENMRRYVKNMSNDSLYATLVIDNYIFTLFNYVNGFVPATRTHSHVLGNLKDLIGKFVPSNLGLHRLILYTAPDRKSQIVLYVFGGKQKVDWEKHPNVQLIHADGTNVKVTTKNPDGSYAVYGSGHVGPVMIPADTEHLLEGSNVAFLSTYFPAEDEPVLKIDGIPVYQEWGQPRLSPPRDE